MLNIHLLEDMANSKALFDIPYKWHNLHGTCNLSIEVYAENERGETGIYKGCKDKASGAISIYDFSFHPATLVELRLNSCYNSIVIPTWRTCPHHDLKKKGK